MTGHGRVDAVVAGRDVERREAAEDADGPEVQAQLFDGLAEGRGLEGFARVLLAAGEGDLAAVVEDPLRAPRQEDAGADRP